jgi:intracellular septation protein
MAGDALHALPSMDFPALRHHNSMFMKLLFDIFPVVLFFAAYKFADIYVATGVAIVANIGQIAWLRLKGKKIESMMWVSLAIIVVFGGATLLLHDETFIKWKPTVLYWLFGIVLVVAQFGFGKNLIRAMMEKNIALPELIWRRLNLSWATFFILMGFVNLYVAFNYSTDAWVNFKLFGSFGLMLLFIIGQGLILSKHAIEEKDIV